MMRAKVPQAFQHARDIDRYFEGETIVCLLCRLRFRRLARHLASAHEMRVDDYKRQFGLPWTRGLTSAVSVANSKWTDERKENARAIAQTSRFFELAHSVPRRDVLPFAKEQALRNLGNNPATRKADFERRIRSLFQKGASDRVIAKALGVGSSTVNRRTKAWRQERLEN
jgi:hypothetical protein